MHDETVWSHSSPTTIIATAMRPLGPIWAQTKPSRYDDEEELEATGLKKRAVAIARSLAKRSWRPRPSTARGERPGTRSRVLPDEMGSSALPGAQRLAQWDPGTRGIVCPGGIMGVSKA